MTDIQPILLSAITCNRVIFDKVSGMPSIIDIVQTIDAPRYPARHPQIVFFCELTNGHGTTDVTISLVNTQEDEKIISILVFPSKNAEKRAGKRKRTLNYSGNKKQ